MKITTLIFDLGNVVLTNDWHYDCPEKFQAYSDYFCITHEDMERGWDAFYPSYRMGLITEDEFWKGFLEVAGATKIDIEEAKKLWRKYQKPIENMLDLLRLLKQYYRLAALTTIGREWLDYKKAAFNLDSYFQAIISSGYTGLAKPNPQVYKLVMEELNVQSGECLFIDDTPKTLPPAEELGMKVILFSGQADFERKLKNMDIRY